MSEDCKDVSLVKPHHQCGLELGSLLDVSAGVGHSGGRTGSGAIFIVPRFSLCKWRHDVMTVTGRWHSLTIVITNTMSKQS